MRSEGRVRVLERDRGAKLKTTYTPAFVGVKGKVWEEGEGGEGVVIGFVDSGINPNHGSFVYDPSKPFKSSNVSEFRGICETGPRFTESDCNGKIVGARFFSKGAEASATLNPAVDFLSPFDADGHGR